MALEPITRKEKIIAGQDLTPITRMEMFLKNFGGGGGGGGASSADVFIIHATPDETFTNAQLDKTAEQIYDAHQSGKYCLVDFAGTFFPVTTVETNGTKYLMTCHGFMFPANEQAVVTGMKLYTTDGITWEINKLSPILHDVRFEGLQIPNVYGQYYTLSVDADGNLIATLAT